MLARQVRWARDHGFADRLELPVDHGLAAPDIATTSPEDVVGDAIPVTGPLPRVTPSDIHRADIRRAATPRPSGWPSQPAPTSTACFEAGADPTVVDTMRGDDALPVGALGAR